MDKKDKKFHENLMARVQEQVDIQVNEMISQSEILKLGELAKLVSDIKNDDKPIKFENGEYPYQFNSYRGYYDMIAVGSSKEPKTVLSFFKDVFSAIGSSYFGYKGGKYHMDKNTPVWFSDYGEATGMGIVGIEEKKDHVLILTKQVEQYS